MAEISNDRNCKVCNKSNVCKYKERVESKVDRLKDWTESLDIKEFPLSVNINCVEFSGSISILR
jgi:hypothetical protein